jgi:hypothetical protein
MAIILRRRFRGVAASVAKNPQKAFAPMNAAKVGPVCRQMPAGPSSYGAASYTHPARGKAQRGFP